MRRLSVAALNRMAARSEYGRARVLRQRSPGRDGYGHRHDVRYWHKADISLCAAHDPKRTLAVHCGNCTCLH